jgi:hypothetical protein
VIGRITFGQSINLSIQLIIHGLGFSNQSNSCEIDHLVYEVNGLAEDEIKIVEVESSYLPNR